MNDTLRNLLPEHLSDEAACHLVDFFYELAQAFESIYLGQIMRYKKSMKPCNCSMYQGRTQNKKEEGLGPPF